MPSGHHHLIICVHGIGPQEGPKSFGMTLKSCMSSLSKTFEAVLQSHFPALPILFSFKPVEWHNVIHEYSDYDKNMEAVSLDTIPKIRILFNDAISDIFLFMSASYYQPMIDSVTEQLNRAWEDFVNDCPDPSMASVSIFAHSLGGVLIYELLMSQESSLVNAGKADWKTVGQRTHGAAVYPKLRFKISNFFMLGSPVGAYLSLAGAPLGAFQAPSPGLCKHTWNVFHPNDPVAYRFEPWVYGERYRWISPVMVEHHAGTKRLHYRIREISDDLSKRVAAMSDEIRGNLHQRVSGMSESLSTSVAQFSADLRSNLPSFGSLPTLPSLPNLSNFNIGRSLSFCTPEFMRQGVSPESLVGGLPSQNFSETRPILEDTSSTASELPLPEAESDAADRTDGDPNESVTVVSQLTITVKETTSKQRRRGGRPVRNRDVWIVSSAYEGDPPPGVTLPRSWEKDRDGAPSGQGSANQGQPPQVSYTFSQSQPSASPDSFPPISEYLTNPHMTGPISPRTPTGQSGFTYPSRTQSSGPFQYPHGPLGGGDAVGVGVGVGVATLPATKSSSFIEFGSCWPVFDWAGRGGPNPLQSDDSASESQSEHSAGHAARLGSTSTPRSQSPAVTSHAYSQAPPGHSEPSTTLSPADPFQLQRPIRPGAGPSSFENRPPSSPTFASASTFPSTPTLPSASTTSASPSSPTSSGPPLPSPLGRASNAGPTLSGRIFPFLPSSASGSDRSEPTVDNQKLDRPVPDGATRSDSESSRPVRWSIRERSSASPRSSPANPSPPIGGLSEQQRAGSTNQNAPRPRPIASAAGIPHEGLEDTCGQFFEMLPTPDSSGVRDKEKDTLRNVRDRADTVGSPRASEREKTRELVHGTSSVRAGPGGAVHRMVEPMPGEMRYDYMLQEAPVEALNEYISSLRAHVSYWDSKDVGLFIVSQVTSQLCPEYKRKDCPALAEGEMDEHKVFVRNLDTGEVYSWDEVDVSVPKGVDPARLSGHDSAFLRLKGLMQYMFPQV